MKRTFIYYLVLSLRFFFERVPRSLSQTSGGLLGLALFHIQQRDSFRAEKHLQAAYGSRFSARRKTSLARQAFINAGLNVADVARLARHYRDEFADLIDVEGLEFLQEVYQRGRGVVAVTGHIGNFELLAAFCARRGFRTAVIGRQLYDLRLDRLIRESRGANGVITISTKQPRRLIKSLRQGFVVGTLIDNDSQRVAGEFVESYGRLAYTPIGQTYLGLRLGAGFVPVVCRRVSGRYHLRFFEEVKAREELINSKDRRLAAVELNWKLRKILDSQVDLDPSQWIWTHNRWRSRPANENASLPGLQLYRQRQRSMAGQRGQLSEDLSGQSDNQPAKAPLNLAPAG